VIQNVVASSDDADVSARGDKTLDWPSKKFNLAAWMAPDVTN
jgi:hypothetical protein